MNATPIRALVSGASSGIGLAFSRRLAEHCSEIIVTGRDQARLEALVAELSARGLHASLIAADLGTTLGRAQLVETIRQRGPLRYLVNCAGFGTLGPFASQHPDSQEGMVRLHIDATLALSRAALAGMREAGGGYLVNVSSLAALAPMAGLAVYAATKSFLNTYSMALQQEVREQNIKVQCLCPGYTRTQFHRSDDFKGFDAAQVPEACWMDADDVARESLAALHSGDARVLVIPGEINRQWARQSLERQLAELTTPDAT